MVMSWQILEVLLAAVVYGVPAAAFLFGAMLLIVEGESLVVSDSAPRGWATALGFVMMVGAVVGLFFMSSLVERV